jgi:hypothetical protein
MADLFVHYTTAHVLGRPMADPRKRLFFAVGNCLPDLMYKSFHFFTSSPSWYTEATHAPLMLLTACYALAFLFEAPLRRAAWGLLFAGSLCHLAVDVGKDYIGMGVILWAFPFSLDRVELGWYHTEESPLAWPWCVAAIAITEAVWRLRRRPAAG